MRKLFLPVILISLLLSACNVPVPATSEGISQNDQAATIVAQTLTAVANDAGSDVPPASPTTVQQPLASPTAGDAPTIQPNVTPTIGTGTATATTLTVDSNTNCREGPSTNYKVVIVLVPGTTYQIIARSQDNTYWIVTEIGKSTTCWVPAEMSNAFGNVTLLPAVTPAAPTASAAGSVTAPTGLSYQFFCTFNGVNSTIDVTLKWTDRSNNETGYRVYRDNAAIADLPANSTTYADTFNGSATQLITYRISAYNDLGEALGNPITFSCNG